MKVFYAISGRSNGTAAIAVEAANVVMCRELQS